MPADRPASFVPVDDLLPRLDLEAVAAYYGVPLPELQRIGDEIRTACFLRCGKPRETGDRALAIQALDPTKRWYCHQYGCGKKGNLVGICDLLKEGENAGGRPRGERFKAIAADLRRLAEGRLSSPEASPPSASPAAPPTVKTPTAKAVPRNVPLAESPNERARALVNLDEKFVQDIARMPPAASAYFRRRPWLTEELRRKWRTGYLPRDADGDKAGGTMRGSVVYPLLSERGEVLTWFGRDPGYEEQHRRWAANGRSGPEPEKFHFVKGFHRSLELFGQQASRLDESGHREALERNGLVVVEGPNDVIRLDALGVPAVGLLSNVASDAQVSKIARWARRIARNRVLLMLDCDAEGEAGMKRTLYELAQHCDVRVPWSERGHGGRFKGRQPESLSPEEWDEIMRRAA